MLIFYAALAIFQNFNNIPENIYRVEGNITFPELIEAPAPDWKAFKAAADNWQGVFVFEIIIDKKGYVRNIQNLRPSPTSDKVFEIYAKSISRWKFKPSTLNGKPINVYYTITKSCWRSEIK